MSEIGVILKALNVATTHLPEDRQAVLDAFNSIRELQDKLATIREALVTVVYGDADIRKCDIAIDMVDIINGI